MVRTGQTVYEQILSTDANNNPVSAATFTNFVFKDGVLFTGLTVNVSLAQDLTGMFTSSWSADTVGDYQIYYKNDNTSVVYISEIHRVRPDSEFDQNIYIGL